MSRHTGVLMGVRNNVIKCQLGWGSNIGQKSSAYLDGQLQRDILLEATSSQKCVQPVKVLATKVVSLLLVSDPSVTEFEMKLTFFK